MNKTDTAKLGQQAMDYIADYPLYASTSGITYSEAIAIANILDKNWLKSQEAPELFKVLNIQDMRKSLETLTIRKEQ